MLPSETIFLIKITNRSDFHNKYWKILASNDLSTGLHLIASSAPPLTSDFLKLSPHFSKHYIFTYRTSSSIQSKNQTQPKHHKREDETKPQNEIRHKRILMCWKHFQVSLTPHTFLQKSKKKSEDVKTYPS